MSRVNLGDVYNGMKEISQERSIHTFLAAKDIEVVPRKMVEMIIDRCEEEYQIAKESAHDSCKSELMSAYYTIKRYAEALLNTFEENEEQYLVYDNKLIEGETFNEFWNATYETAHLRSSTSLSRIEHDTDGNLCVLSVSGGSYKPLEKDDVE